MIVNIGPFPEGDEERKIEVHVDDYDTWNLDYTLGVIIAAALKKFIECPDGGPFIANEDVPVEIQRPSDAIDWQTDPFWFDRWNWVLNEMLFAFEYGNQDDSYDTPTDVLIANDKRANEGRRLFAKYFHNLWN